MKIGELKKLGANKKTGAGIQKDVERVEAIAEGVHFVTKVYCYARNVLVGYIARQIAAGAESPILSPAFGTKDKALFAEDFTFGRAKEREGALQWALDYLFSLKEDDLWHTGDGLTLWNSYASACKTDEAAKQYLELPKHEFTGEGECILLAMARLLVEMESLGFEIGRKESGTYSLCIRYENVPDDVDLSYRDVEDRIVRPLDFSKEIKALRERLDAFERQINN